MARAFRSFGLLNHSFWADGYIIAGMGLPRNCTLRAGGPMRSRCTSNVGARGKPVEPIGGCRQTRRKQSLHATIRDTPSSTLESGTITCSSGSSFQRFQKILRVVTFSPFFGDGAAEKKLL